MALDIKGMRGVRLSDEVQSASNGSRRSIARVLSSIENGTLSLSQALESLSPIVGEVDGWSIMAITGAPGVGKSVLVDALMSRWAHQGHNTALLAVDPSSPRSGGALLGDRVRMTSVDDEAIKERVYVRSIATRATSGSVPLIVEDMAKFLVAIGWNRVLIETVGAGQSELRCAAVADRIVVVEGPARGDGIQAEKAGLLELADAILVNKCDLEGAEKHASELKESFGLGAGEAPPIMLTSGLTGEGIESAASLLHDLPSSQRAKRARMRERLLAQHERRLTSHPLYNRVMEDLAKGTLDIEKALMTLKGENHERSG